MLNEEQNRNYSRCQKLAAYLDENEPIYNAYVPFSKEAQNFNINFELFKEYTIQKQTNGSIVTAAQRGLKTKIADTLTDICGVAIAYAERYNEVLLAADIDYSKTSVIRVKDADVYGLVYRVVKRLQSLLINPQFTEYGITAAMLDDLLADATTFRDNMDKSSVIESGGSVANKNINEVIKQLDKNVKTFERLINRFSANHPDFVAGFRINASIESPATRHTGITGTVTDAATGKGIQNAVVTLVSVKKADATEAKKTTTNSKGSFAIISMYGGEYQMQVTAPGFTAKTIQVRVTRGKVLEQDITL